MTGPWANIQALTSASLQQRQDMAQLGCQHLDLDNSITRLKENCQSHKGFAVLARITLKGIEAIKCRQGGEGGDLQPRPRLFSLSFPFVCNKRQSFSLSPAQYSASLYPKIVTRLDTCVISWCWNKNTTNIVAGLLASTTKPPLK